MATNKSKVAPKTEQDEVTEIPTIEPSPVEVAGDALVESFSFEGEEEVTEETRKREKEFYSKKYVIHTRNDLRLGRKLYHRGKHTVPRDIAEVLAEMDNKKTANDMSVHVGKNYLRERGLDGTLKITEVQNLSKQLASR